MQKIGLIPSRLESSRLSNKALLDICGYPMIIHVAKRAAAATELDAVVVCTDSHKIARVCIEHNVDVCLTKSDHRNGTERIAEAAFSLGLSKEDLVVDIQGDEPLVTPHTINEVAKFTAINNFDIVVPHVFLDSEENVNRVKLITSGENVIYMSRRNLPYPFLKNERFKKHLSIIGFKTSALMNFAELPPGELEQVEGIELLRAVENKFDIGTFKLQEESVSVDTQEDFEKVLRIFQNKSSELRYVSQ